MAKNKFQTRQFNVFNACGISIIEYVIYKASFTIIQLSLYLPIFNCITTMLNVLLITPDK